MKKIELEVYSQSVNQAVVKMPNRRFPALVIQGDTVSNLTNLARSIYGRSKTTSDVELVEESGELLDQLENLLLHYEGVLIEHDLDLPYSSKPLNS